MGRVGADTVLKGKEIARWRRSGWGLCSNWARLQRLTALGLVQIFVVGGLECAYTASSPKEDV